MKKIQLFVSLLIVASLNVTFLCAKYELKERIPQRYIENKSVLEYYPQKSALIEAEKSAYKKFRDLQKERYNVTKRYFGTLYPLQEALNDIENDIGYEELPEYKEISKQLEEKRLDGLAYYCLERPDAGSFYDFFYGHDFNNLRKNLYKIKNDYLSEKYPLYRDFLKIKESLKYDSNWYEFNEQNIIEHDEPKYHPLVKKYSLSSKLGLDEVNARREYFNKNNSLLLEEVNDAALKWKDSYRDFCCSGS